LLIDRARTYPRRVAGGSLVDCNFNKPRRVGQRCLRAAPRLTGYGAHLARARANSQPPHGRQDAAGAFRLVERHQAARRNHQHRQALQVDRKAIETAVRYFDLATARRILGRDLDQACVAAHRTVPHCPRHGRHRAACRIKLTRACEAETDTGPDSGNDPVARVRPPRRPGLFARAAFGRRPGLRRVARSCSAVTLILHRRFWP
jgi:hypothetical protein